MARHLPDHIGRVRINRDEAELLSRLLWEYRQEMMEGRKMEHGDPVAVTRYNRELHVTRGLFNELRLLSEQKGWFIHEPERQDEAPADPRLPH